MALSMLAGRGMLSQAMAARGGLVGAQARGLSKKKAPPKEKDGKTRFSITKIDTFKVEDGPEPYSYADKEELLGYFETMYRMRRMEMAADRLYVGGYVRGFCHLYDGQEAVAVGMDKVLTYEDPLITAYRNHCQQLSRGSNVAEILAELTGRYTGVSKGKGGSMHMYHAKNNYYGGNGIVGAQGPLGAGLGLALKYEKKKNCAVTMFGDGAANQGQIAEAINMAVLWKLPVLFVCENNQYGMGTSTERASAIQEFYKRENYIPGMRIDGMDVLAVKEAMTFAKDYAINEGPMYLEFDTYRYHGHSMSDPGVSYRSKDEIKDIKKSRDPIDKVKLKLLESEWTTNEELNAIELVIKKEVDEATEFAKSSEFPPESELFTNVYSDMLPTRGTLMSKGNSVGWLAQ